MATVFIRTESRKNLLDIEVMSDDFSVGVELDVYSDIFAELLLGEDKGKARIFKDTMVYLSELRGCYFEGCEDGVNFSDKWTPLEFVQDRIKGSCKELNSIIGLNLYDSID